MRVYLTKDELTTESGTALLELCLAITSDGKVDLQEIKDLHRWLRKHIDDSSIVAIGYLSDIMKRITADGVIDRDELIELHLAIERVIPVALRTPAIQARKKRDAARAERRKQKRAKEKEIEKAERERQREREVVQANRIRHEFCKVAGITFPNEDGSERQDIASQCHVGENVYFNHDTDNQHSMFAVAVLRRDTHEQLGHVPAYLSDRLLSIAQEGYLVAGVITEITGGTFSKSSIGINLCIFYVAQEVAAEELQAYSRRVLGI